MQVTILGKRIVRKVDKVTGVIRENCVIHIKYLDDMVEGEAVRTAWVSNRCCPPEDIIVGAEYELSEFNGYIIKLLSSGQATNVKD